MDLATDYGGWIRRSVRFVCGILTSGHDVGGGIHVAPLDADEYHALTRKLDRPVPAPIRRFLLEGGARYQFEYWPGYLPQERSRPLVKSGRDGIPPM